MSNVSLTGKIVSMNNIISYNKNGREGKVASFMIGDETGTVRGVFWDKNHIEKIENGKINVGTVLKLKNCYVKSNNGYKEVHLGNRGDVEISPNGVNIEVNDKPSFEFNKKKIIELQENDNGVGVVGTIVQAFEPNFYEACKLCGKKLVDGECREHGKSDNELVPIINIILDDSTDTIRCVAFRRQAEELTGLDLGELIKLRENPGDFEKVREDLLGKQLMLIGRISKNAFFDRKEMMIQRVEEVDPDGLLKEMEKEQLS